MGHDLVGREVELAVFDELIGHARSARAQVMTVEGEAGMGKSALLAAFVGQSRDDVLARWVRCDEFEQGQAFRVVGRLLGDDGLSTTSDVTAGRRLLALLGDLQAAHDGLVLIAVDDAQWIDRSSARALTFALRRLRADRVLCVIARRPGTGDLGTLTENPSATTALRLGPLGADSVRRLARQLRAWDLPIDLAQRLVTRTGGVPLLVTAVVRNATDVRQLESGADVRASVGTEAGRMLASVDPEARRLVEAAAVLADPTDLVVLGRIAGLTDPVAAVTSATDAGLVSLDDASRVTCAHELLCAAIYAGIPLTRRRDLHTQAAAWTTGDRRLAHRTAAADRPDPQLEADLLEAAAAARSSQSFGVAADHLLRARQVTDDPAQRERHLVAAMIERVEAQDLDSADELARSVRDTTSTTERSLALGLLARERGQVGPAATLLGEAVELAASTGDVTAHARAAVAAAVLHVRLGDGAAAVEVLAGVGAVDDAELCSDVVTNRALGLWQAGDLDRALEQADAASASRGATGWQADRLAVRGLLRIFAGRVPQAIVDLDAAVRIVHLWRPSTNQSRTYRLRSMARFLVGDWDGAAVDAAAARALAQESSQPWSAAMALAASAEVPTGRGQWEVAADYLARARSALSDASGPNMADTVLGHHVALHAAREDHLAVLDALEPVWSEEYVDRIMLNRTGREILQARIRASIGLGRLAAAERDLLVYDATIRRLPAGPVPSRLGWLSALLAEARSDPGTAREHYAEDFADPQTMENPFVLAQLLLASGKLERALGNRREAIDRLTRATDIFTRLMAAPYLERTNAQLAACGLHSPVADPFALTQREQDVAALVIRGHTNKEAAAELFVTAKTVEYHLRNIYAKLGITSRSELRRRG